MAKRTHLDHQESLDAFLVFSDQCLEEEEPPQGLLDVLEHAPDYALLEMYEQAYFGANPLLRTIAGSAIRKREQAIYGEQVFSHGWLIRTLRDFERKKFHVYRRAWGMWPKMVMVVPQDGQGLGPAVECLFGLVEQKHPWSETNRKVAARMLNEWLQEPQSLTGVPRGDYLESLDKGLFPTIVPAWKSCPWS